VDDNRIDLKAGLRELAAEEAGGAGPHVGMKRLIAFREGTLAAADRESVEEHLSLCPRCTRLLRELRDFAAAAASGEAGPESLRQEAWESLAARLQQETPVARPIAITGPSRARRRAPLVFLAAALLLAILGFVLWTVGAARQERQVARLEQQLRERDASIAALRKSLAEAERRLASRGESRDPERKRLAQQVAELTAALAELRAEPNRPERREQLARASADVAVAVSPRFVLRGEAPPGGEFLRSGGAVNEVRLAPREERLSVLLGLAEQAEFDEYRLELLDRQGHLLWAGRRPRRSLIGDAGTAVSIDGLGTGRFRLRIEGLRPDGGDLLAEYVLEVEAP
jgi:hypothetical protein